uniref:DUF106 domain-containing protein n=1 Tax=Fervidicoccus fontis TaxID=683846 RepID=A0A7J3ZKE4_9CREN
MLSEAEQVLLLVHLAYLAASILTGYLVRLFANPLEARRLRLEIDALASHLPPKRARVTRKLEKKARIIESELSVLRKKYARLSIKRIGIVSLVYGLAFWTVVVFFPPALPAPVHVPFITKVVDGTPVIPTLYLFIFGLFLLSPLATRISEPPIEELESKEGKER